MCRCAIACAGPCGTGRDAELWRSLDEAQERARSAAHWWAASFDAEAFGLLGLDAGYLPNAHWAALDKVLTQIETRELAVEHLSAARARQEITTAPETASVEMDRAAVTAGARGSTNRVSKAIWIFATCSPKLGYFRKLFSVVRASFNDTGSVLGTQTEPPAAALPPAGARFLALAEEVYAAHQHGFGALGVGGREYWAWENVRHTFLYLRLAQLAADPGAAPMDRRSQRRWQRRQIWRDGRQLAMFSGYGGRPSAGSISNTARSGSGICWPCRRRVTSTAHRRTRRSRRLRRAGCRRPGSICGPTRRCARRSRRRQSWQARWTWRRSRGSPSCTGRSQPGRAGRRRAGAAHPARRAQRLVVDRRRRTAGQHLHRLPVRGRRDRVRQRGSAGCGHPQADRACAARHHGFVPGSKPIRPPPDVGLAVDPRAQPGLCRGARSRAAGLTRSRRRMGSAAWPTGSTTPPSPSPAAGPGIYGLERRSAGARSGGFAGPRSAGARHVGVAGRAQGPLRLLVGKFSLSSI